MIEGVDAVQSRISALRALTEGSDEGPLAGAANTIESTTEFDPFGDTYQAALEQRDLTLATNPAALMGTGSSFTALAARSSGLAYGALGSYGGYGSYGTMSGYGIPGVSAYGPAAMGQAGLPGVRAVGGYGEMPVPDVLRAYGNGNIPAAALTEISQSGHRLYAPAAASWNSLVAAARAEGIDLRITDSYRSYEEQVDLVRRKGLYSEGGYGATPGTSNHGWGLAVDADVTDDRTRRWLQVNGPRFGWVEAVPREPWHWEFRPHQV